MSPTPIRLQMLSDAPDEDGEPQCGLLVPPSPSSVSRRPILVLFANVAAAIEAKRGLETGG